MKLMDQKCFHNIKALTHCLIIFFSVFAFPPHILSQDAPLIRALEIRGNKKIEEATIRAKIKTDVGQIFDKKTVQDDIRTLYRLGYFDDVAVELESFEGGVKLIFTLKEKPTMTSIKFEGNDKIKESVIREQLTIPPGAIANNQLLNDAIKKLEAFYQIKGYWHVKIIPIMRVISQDEVALTFQIDEGPKVLIKKITIIGNSTFSDKEIKKVLRTKEKWILSFITGAGFYNKDVMLADMENIRTLYHTKGFLDVTISEPVVKLSGDNLYVEITLDEGPQYRVGKFTVSGNKLFPSTQLLTTVKTKTGEVFNKSALKRDIEKIKNDYMQKGYAMIDVNPEIKVDRERLIVDVNLSVTEGEIFTIGRINITGNERTRDKVIRREIRLDEGDKYNNALIDRSKQKITNLQFFDSVDIQPVVKQELKEVDLNVKVKERLTGMLSIGGGYSSEEKLIGLVEITQTNLFGRGLDLKVSGELSRKTLNYNLRLTDPWLFDRPYSGTVQLFNEEYEFPSYTREAKGVALGLGKEFSDFFKADMIYRFENVRTKEIDDDASQFIKDQEGTRTTSSVTWVLTHNSINNFADPTSGSRNQMIFTLAGLGGSNQFYSGTIDSGWYFPFKWDTTLSVRGRFGYADGWGNEELPIYERFYVGGINTVRGINFGEAGPRDENGEKIGGDMEFIVNAEWIFPLIPSLRVKGVVFHDVGTAYDRKGDYDFFSDLTRTAGAGVRWISPFGPIRVEWGYNISQEEDQETSRFEFAFGSAF
jgi:outer membrane protein insertion porin family